jgi:CubicO group peptidase (beta-lactamase class C family)
MADRENPATDITSYDNLESLALHLMEKWLVPGVTVGILKDGERSLHAFGTANIDTELPMREDMLLQIGSISKVFTATLVMRLVQEGKLDLDTPIKEYLPDLELKDEDALNTITVRHTLSHTSGLFGDVFDDHGAGDDALTRAVAAYKDVRQLTAPGELWAYCNSGFNLTGAVIEKLLDTTFEAAMKEYVFDPLGLDHSVFFATEAITYPNSVGHTQVKPGADELEVARPYQLPRCVNPAGGIIGNVNDLLSFAEFHINGGKVGDEQVLDSALVAAMQETQTTAANFSDEWGIGWDLNTIDGELVIGHGGSTNGFQARLSIVPGQKFAVAVLTNGNQGWAVNNPIAQWAIHHYCGVYRPAPTPIERPSEELEQFAGKYTHPNGTTTVSVDNGELKMVSVSRDRRSGEEKELPPVWAAPISDDEFVATTGASHGMRIDFIRNTDGSLRFMRTGGRLLDRE